ncbi:YqjK family protein [Halotalea alkalilenta]|uniref:YqjK family protein n=1 Tax=Halotalea alkalilenta TaxID=376489 RepID=UPI000484F290|nr:YqjK family protein [Halotalea alkalilenta]
MSKEAKSHSPAEQRRRIERRIELERRTIAAAVDEWHVATASIDRSVEKLARFKRPAMIIGGYFMLRVFKRPGRLMRLAKRGIGLYALSRNLRGLLK